MARATGPSGRMRAPIFNAHSPHDGRSALGKHVELAITETVRLFEMKKTGPNTFTWLTYTFSVVDGNSEPLETGDVVCPVAYLEWEKPEDSDELIKEFVVLMEDRIPLMIRRSLWAMLAAGGCLIDPQ